MKEVLVLKDLECIKAIAHPRRVDILKMFKDLPLSAKQISQALDEPHAKINYHIKALYKVGILELVEEKIKSGIVEKYYYPSAKNIVIGKNVLDFSLNTEEEKKTLHLSRYEELSELFYKAVEEEIIENNDIIDYHNVRLTHEELLKLQSSIKYNIEEIINSRTSDSNELMYDIAMLSIPLAKEEYNI